MKKIMVKDIMVRLSEYVTVYEDVTLFDAILVLEKSKEQFNENHYKHRAILVRSRADDKIIGKISQLDVLRGLEPKYKMMGNEEPLGRFGFSDQGLGIDYMKQIKTHYKLWDESLTHICRKIGVKKVSELMYTPTEGEYVAAGDNLSEAAHQLIMGQHQSLLVISGREIVGILRLTDVFTKICDIMKEVHQA